MSVLVAYASAHSSTAVIAQQIADRLMKSGFTALVRPVDQIQSIALHQTVVLGSEVQQQECLPEATEFLRRFSGQLSKLPVWLFSTGPVSEPNDIFGLKVRALVDPAGYESPAVADAPDAIQVRDHRHFADVFQRGRWSLLADLFLKVCGGSPADRRDWRNVNAWAADIARELHRIDHVKERRRLHLSVRGRP